MGIVEEVLNRAIITESNLFLASTLSVANSKLTPAIQGVIFQDFSVNQILREINFRES